MKRFFLLLPLLLLILLGSGCDKPSQEMQFMMKLIGEHQTIQNQVDGIIAQTRFMRDSRTGECYLYGTHVPSPIMERIDCSKIPEGKLSTGYEQEE